MQKSEVIQQVLAFAKEHFQMVLATNGDHPWVAVLYYTVDEDLNFYFLSDPKTIHCQHITDNPQVAISIADSPQQPTADKIGLQLYGQASQISGRHKVTHAINLWKKTLDISSDDYSYEGMTKKLISGRMYKVTPLQIRFFNETLWDEGTEPLITV